MKPSARCSVWWSPRFLQRWRWARAWSEQCCGCWPSPLALGSATALKQTNIKRLLAYSSIALFGYLLIGVLATALVGDQARGPLLLYLAAYTFTTIGAFGVVAWIGNRGDEQPLDDWAGLASRPGAAGDDAIFMLSLGGVPPTAGFFAQDFIYFARRWAAGAGAAGGGGGAQQRRQRLLLRVVTAMYFARWDASRSRFAPARWRRCSSPSSPWRSASRPAGSSTPPTPPSPVRSCSS